MARVDLQATVRHLGKLAGPAPPDADAPLLRRFVAHGDEAAFATLVRRYTGLVYAVCRRVLQQDQDAEDALQATFLVLAGRARSIHKGQALASWLHGVAYRTALDLRKRILRRRRHEEKVFGLPPESPVTEASLRELQGILDAEVNALPERFRAPFVLCCCEGRSRAEAARDLGWKEGTVSSRLAQARERLRQRLARRGVVLTAVLSAVAVAGDAPAMQPLLAGVVRAAGPFAAGRAAASLPDHIIALAEGVLRTMSRAAVKRTLTVCLVTLLLGWGIGHIVPGPPTPGLQAARSQVGEAQGKIPEGDDAKRPAPEAQVADADRPPEVDVVNAGQTALEIAQQTKDPDTKWRAVRILGSLRYEPAVPFLLEALANPHPNVRANAARALGDMRVAQAAKPLTELLSKETNAGVIQQTALALANLRCSDALPALRAAANHDDVQTRVWVLQAIGRVGSRKDVPFLARFLMGDLSPTVQQAAAQAMERITGADFGFPKGSGPSSPEMGLQRARAWWEQHKAEFAAEDHRGEAELVAQERQRLRGSWQVVGIERPDAQLTREQVDELAYGRAKALAADLGAKPPPQDVGGLVVDIDDGKWTVRTGTGVVLESATLTIDPKTRPRSIDVKPGHQGKARPGIYQFEDEDTLVLCFSRSGERPTSFSRQVEEKSVLKRIRTK